MPGGGAGSSVTDLIAFSQRRKKKRGWEKGKGTPVKKGRKQGDISLPARIMEKKGGRGSE